ncbi:fumarylacetoacetate hydrolase family protein [Puniceibacterium sediminis]|uniref:2-keto-4-pentenoate hydratase/2-oxohepta-3-ene-1,7-dioic acid hydratase (Catechol pathway) n=1 Tax=Puniceibacterium sediminis TaxID=1608407 RepID=A0A238XQP3_9RHOB|nr:fumarylacetoacetate hydrolase family protein [Puniceibacterium sediminis]SNR61002.1 2-keto-4-pentenoate hydratase/2-oxohepta-3-ene-1,7-dioic acid hydratase (catechol pathway) [Puniceibacterium sediminis]
MEWARATCADGRIVTGVISEGMLHPRLYLGSDEATDMPEDLAAVTLLPPCVPGKFIGLWNNFHAAATRNNWTPPEHPLYFLKPDTSLSGPAATVTIPATAGRILFEGELGIVIGQTCRNISAEDAAAAIMGYTCVNDLTSIDILNADPSFPQWTRAKGFDGFGVIGPVIATGLDWQDLTIKVLVNGRERQSYPAADMIIPPSQIVSALSQDMTLNPCDVIACGTSVGARPVKAGDQVDVVIEGIGTLGVTMAAEETQG